MEPIKEDAPRRRPPRFCQPLLLELAGCMNDDLVTELAGRLRKYRNRYNPILRLMVTLVANNADESAIFPRDENTMMTATHGRGDEEGQTGDAASRKRPRDLHADFASLVPGDKPSSDAHTQPHTSTERRASAPASSSAPLITRPPWAITANKVTPVVRRLHATPVLSPAAAAAAAASSSSTPATAQSSSSSAASLTPPTNTAALARATVLNTFESFMAFDFLPLAVTHNRLRAYERFYQPGEGREPPRGSMPFTSSDVSRLVLKQYVHDAARTAAFLVADRELGVAALVDPRLDDVSVYLADLRVLRLRLTDVVVTHCFLDCALAVDALREAEPGMTVSSGLPLCAAGTTKDIFLQQRAASSDSARSALVGLRTIAVPSFSPESILVELRLRGVLVAVFCGTAWGTDAAPRSDYFASFAQLLAHEEAASPRAPQESESHQNAAKHASQTRPHATHDVTAPFWTPSSFYDQESMRTAQANLKKYWYDAYLYPTAPPAAAATRTTTHANTETEMEAAELERRLCADTVVVFPSHGGYSNVTNQLDLYWAMHVHDLRQMQHAKRVIETLTSSDIYVKFNRRMPPLPRAMLYQANRRVNLQQLLRAGRGEAPVVCGREGHAPGPRLSPPLPPVLLDLRDQNAYHAHHITGAINVPMSFPSSAFGAKRAELWLQCLLIPGQPIFALCQDASHRRATHARLRAVSPEAAVIAIATLEEVLASPESVRTGSCQSTPTSPIALPLPSAPCLCAVTTRSLPLLPAMFVGSEDTQEQEACMASAAGLFPEHVRWVHHSTPLERLSSVESLRAIEPRADTLVVDVRTPYEFKNGSHQHSVHYQLCDLCTDTAADTLRLWRSTVPSSSSPTHTPPSFVASPALGGMWVRKLHTDGLVAGLSVEKEVQRLHQICLYCAGGYRSLIAESLLARALSVAAPESVVQSTADGPLTLTSAATSLCWLHTLKLVDVPGGAFQIMTQRPDLWRVKDRSIVCIS